MENSMKRITSVLLIALAVLMLTLFVACGDDAPATTKPATTTAPIETSDSLETTAKTPDTTTKKPDVTTSKPAADFVEAEHVAKTDSGVTVKSLDQSLVMNIAQKDGGIVYTLVSGDTEIIGESTMGITVASTDLMTGATIESVTAKELNVPAFFGQATAQLWNIPIAEAGGKADCLEVQKTYERWSGTKMCGIAQDK